MTKSEIFEKKVLSHVLSNLCCKMHILLGMRNFFKVNESHFGFDSQLKFLELGIYPMKNCRWWNFDFLGGACL